MHSHLALAGLLLVGAIGGLEAAATTAAPDAAVSAFPDARLKIEFNSTDGDAGLQVLLDAPPWREVVITNPAGRVLAEFDAGPVIDQFGLTELFAESSEPPFDEFPFEEFKRLFPEGVYTFRGTTIDGERLRSRFRLSHDVPDGPVITSPTEDATVPPDGLVVQWLPDASPPGVDVVAYEVLVVADDPFVGNPTQVLDVMLPADATSFPVPAVFLTPGSYKTEVLAIEAGGNQTLTEVAFTVSGG